MVEQREQLVSGDAHPDLIARVDREDDAAAVLVVVLPQVAVPPLGRARVRARVRVEAGARVVRVCIAGSTCPDMSNTVKPRLPLANSSTEKPTVGTTSVEVDCRGDGGRVTAG